MGDRFSRSLSIAKESYRILKGNPALMLFPILSGLAAIIVSIPFLVPLALAAFGQSLTKHDVAFGALHYALLAGMYFVNYFVIIFFNAGLVACANEELNGRKTTFAFGIESAMRRLPQIAGWAVIASTVGLVLRTISERTGVIGRVVTSLIGLAWNFAVFFVVPALVIEKVGPITAVKSSTKMIRQTWGERIIVGVGTGYVAGLLAVATIVPVGLAVSFFVAQMIALGILMVVVSIAYVVGLVIVFTALNTVLQTAIYVFCKTGEAPLGFEAASLAGAFQQKPAGKFFGKI